MQMMGHVTNVLQKKKKSHKQLQSGEKIAEDVSFHFSKPDIYCYAFAGMP